jgi:hypothetical protein
LDVNKLCLSGRTSQPYSTGVGGAERRTTGIQMHEVDEVDAISRARRPIERQRSQQSCTLERKPTAAK